MFAALPRELQEELRSAYHRKQNAQPPGKPCNFKDTVYSKTCLQWLAEEVQLSQFVKCYWSKISPQSFSAAEQRNPLLQLKQPGAGVSMARVKRRYKRKNAVSPAKKAPSPLKRHVDLEQPGQSPAAIDKIQGGGRWTQGTELIKCASTLGRQLVLFSRLFYFVTQSRFCFEDAHFFHHPGG